ncbi:MAG: hypothetical protein M5U01_15220 [Ardenticatenaceae bacterium]|nr:hypothetical protein [Ardenticatenaceae bacterium]
MDVAVLYESTTAADMLSAEIWLPRNPRWAEQVSSPAPWPESELSVSQTVLLPGPIAPGWNLVQLLAVALEQDDDGYYIASDDLFVVYGEGETQTDALQDYIVSLIEYYQLLAAEAAPDNPPVLAQFHHLRRYLRPSR